MNDMINAVVKRVIKASNNKTGDLSIEDNMLCYALIMSIPDINYADDIVKACKQPRINDDKKLWFDTFPIDMTIRYAALNIIHTIDHMNRFENKDIDKAYSMIAMMEDAILHDRIKQYNNDNNENKFLISIDPLVKEGMSQVFYRYHVAVTQPYQVSCKDDNGKFDIKLFLKYRKINDAMRNATKIITIMDNDGIVYQTPQDEGEG